MRRIIKTMLLLIALILSICTFAQNVAVTKQLKAKYSIVEYNKSNGGWYLIGKQEGTETLYGFCNKLGKVIAFGGKEYKIYDAFIEFYMPDPALKKAYDEWKKEHDEWKKEYNEYDKLRRQYESKKEVIAQELADKENKKIASTVAGSYWASHFLKNSIEFWSQAEAIMLKQGIEKPVIRKEPIMPCEGYQWVQYTFIQPQPYQEIDYRDLRNENYILCSVKKNGLYGLANKITPKKAKYSRMMLLF